MVRFRVYLRPRQKLMQELPPVNTRGKLLPDPQLDAIEAIFYCLQSDNEDLHANGRSENTHVGVLAVGDGSTLRTLGITPAEYDVEIVSDERTLIDAFLEKVRYDWDPECLGGYEVHHASWGYLLERAEAEYGATAFASQCAHRGCSADAARRRLEPGSRARSSPVCGYWPLWRRPV